MKHQAYGLSLIILLGVLACEVSSLVPTGVPTPTSPTATNVRTLTLTLTVARAPTATGDKLVLGKEYGIKVSASKTKKISGSSGRQSDPGYTFLKVQAMFFKRGTEWTDWNPQEAIELSVIDSKGEVFKDQTIFAVVFETRGWFNETIEGWTAGHDRWGVGTASYFSVPDTSAGFRLRYRDLPLIDLEPIPYVPEE